MGSDDRLSRGRFPLASKYHPDWVLAGVSGGANPLWLAEWLSEALDLQPGMRVLDLGCGRAMSSIFLRREFGVQVWAADLWFDPSESLKRVRAAGVDDGVFPMRVDARSLPFASEFFDAIVSIDSFFYYGTDDLYLSELARFVKPGGPIAMANVGLMHEFDGPVPEHLRAWWTPELCGMHSAAWWRRHWERSGLLDVEVADELEDGWKYWRDWHQLIAPDNAAEIAALDADRGQCLGYVRAIGRRRADVPVHEPIRSIPTEYAEAPLLRNP